MSNLKVKESPVIFIPVGHSSSEREIARSNINLAEVLLKRGDAEMTYYNVPDKQCDIFRRRIVVKRISRKEIKEECADLNDVHYTDLPWLGHMTFNQAHRQFRNKFGLAGVVEMIRYIDGYLWNLTVDVDKRPPVALPLKIVSYDKPNVMDTHHALTIDRDLDAFQITDYFNDAPELPPTLCAELIGLGYVIEGNVFSHPLVVGVGSRIMCTLWGKLINHKPPHLTIVSDQGHQVSS